jgi:triacylglycerol esterase/lipase EstA (alpha/beta hydrolase family)
VTTFQRLRSDSGLAEDAMALKEMVERLCGHGGQVDLVGFDRGGLVAAWYAVHLGGEATVRQLVTLGTPWRGTRTSVFRPGGAELRWDNPVLDPLAPPPIPTVCVWSPDDPEIVPTSSSVPAQGVEGVCLEGAGHFDLLLSARAYRAVEDALDRASSATKEVEA